VSHVDLYSYHFLYSVFPILPSLSPIPSSFRLLPLFLPFYFLFFSPAFFLFILNRSILPPISNNLTPHSLFLSSHYFNLYVSRTMHDANALINSLMKLAVLEIQSQLEVTTHTHTHTHTHTFMHSYTHTCRHLAS
jgi:hypothetical protein